MLSGLEEAGVLPRPPRQRRGSAALLGGLEVSRAGKKAVTTGCVTEPTCAGGAEQPERAEGMWEAAWVCVGGEGNLLKMK